MKRYLAVGCMVVLVAAVIGCNKNESAMEQAPENMSMDELGSINSAPAVSPESKAVESKLAQGGAILGQPAVKRVESKAVSQQQVVVPVAAPVNAATEVVSSVPAGVQPVVPEVGKPNPMDIQAALKNAGFYNGKVDGKVGPMTIKAIQEFQKANKLKADGKVGRKTWEALSRHLAPTQSQQ